MSDSDDPEAPRSGPPAGDPAQALSSIELQKQAFVALSAELTRILGDLSRKVSDASERLRDMEWEIVRRKRELETLHEIEASAETLGRLREEQRLERENLERLRAEQGRVREAEQAEARRKFEEELQALRQRAMERHEALDRDHERRERAIVIGPNPSAQEKQNPHACAREGAKRLRSGSVQALARTSLLSLDFWRATTFLCTTLLLEALSSAEMKSIATTRASSFLPSVVSFASLRESVFKRDLTMLLRSCRRRAWRAALIADLVLAMS